MRKYLIVFLAGFFAVALAAGYANAVTGQCSNCHTMHDSQQRTGGTTGTDLGDAGAQDQLLKAGCVTCHTGPHQAGDGRNASFSAPVVLDTVQPGAVDTDSQGGTFTLAGGDFYWVNADEVANAERGHNVIELPGVTVADTNTGLTPPGWDATATNAPLMFNGKTLQVTAAGTWVTQLTCAGQYGCHGYRDAAGFGGLTGAHHENPGTNQQVTAPTTVGNSYRFLAGILGLEHVNHNWNETDASHNEYYGQNDTAAERDDDGTTAYANTDTISFFCAECHGNFHSEIAASAISSPWRRHPTDIVLPTTGETSVYNNDGAAPNTPGTYNLSVPIARGAVPAASANTVNNNTTSTGAIVMCLSCHRAHGSPYNDMLRFDYTDMTVGQTLVPEKNSGCFVCHTNKNG